MNNRSGRSSVQQFYSLVNVKRNTEREKLTEIQRIIFYIIVYFHISRAAPGILWIGRHSRILNSRERIRQRSAYRQSGIFVQFLRLILLIYPFHATHILLRYRYNCSILKCYCNVSGGIYIITNNCTIVVCRPVLGIRWAVIVRQI